MGHKFGALRLDRYTIFVFLTAKTPNHAALQQIRHNPVM